MLVVFMHVHEFDKLVRITQATQLFDFIHAFFETGSDVNKYKDILNEKYACKNRSKKFKTLAGVLIPTTLLKICTTIIYWSRSLFICDSKYSVNLGNCICDFQDFLTKAS